MSAADWVTFALCAFTIGGTVLMCLVDPAGLAEAKYGTRGCCDPDDPRDCAERATCPDAGRAGHTACGTCATHNRPRHRCGCTQGE